MRHRFVFCSALLLGCASSDDLLGGGGSGLADIGTGTGIRPPDGGGGAEIGTGGEPGTGGSLDCLEEEICDGIDNTCDGVADEGCDCQPDETRACFSGDATMPGVGLCAEGTQTCDATGKWSVACDGELLPTDELCDGEDNDCDGTADEAFEPASCGTGLCATTVETCQDGVPQTCVPLSPPDAIEDCDGVDDDCDGTIDEGCVCTTGQTQICYAGPAGTAGVGICSAGMQSCVAGQWGNCVGEVTPGNELCDAIDQDCDSNVNEGSCSLPNAISSCSGGGCVVTDCSLGYDDCDPSDANGCETRHSGSSNNAPGEDLGDWSADAFYGGGCGGGTCDGPILSRTGTQGRHFTISGLESSSCCSYVGMRFDLVVPAGIDYDLYVTGNGCYADPGFSSLGLSGVDESIVIWCDDDCLGGDDGFDLGVEVRYYAGESCEPWSLNVYRRGC